MSMDRVSKSASKNRKREALIFFENDKVKLIFLPEAVS